MAFIAFLGAPLRAWRKLVAGDFGPPFTFWVFYFGVPIVWDIGIQLLSGIALFQSITVVALLQIALLIYVVPVTVGVFRAANKYTGRQSLWALYAKVFSILGTIALALLAFILVRAS